MSAALTNWLDDPAIRRLLTAALGLAVILLATRALQQVLGRRIESSDVRYRSRKIVTFASYILAALVVATVYSESMRNFTVALGVAGAGIAFALQEVIASIAGFVALTFSRFYAPGDRVELGGIKGDVIDIGILRTTLAEIGQWVDGDLYNGRVVRVANSFVFKSPVFNYSADFPFLWDEIKVPVRYGSDRAMTRSILELAAADAQAELGEAAKQAWHTMRTNYRLEETSLDPMITFIGTDNWMEYTVRYVVDYRRRRSTKNRLFTNILDAVDASGGKVQMASGTYEIVAAPEFRFKST